MTRTLVLLAVLLLPAFAWAEDKTKRATYAVKQTLDVAYANGGTRNQLDVFAPKGEKGERFPVVVFVHGGTWMFGDKDFYGIYRNVGKCLAKQGVVTVLINYRLSPLVRHPEHAKDVARAYAWVSKKIDKYGGDPDRIILAGHSAGGHLAALVASDKSYLEEKKLDLSDAQRAGLKGVVCLSGLYRLPRDDEFRDMLGPLVRSMVGDSKDSSMAKALSPMLYMAGYGMSPFPWIFGRDPKVGKQASPLTHVQKTLPPFLLMTAYREVPSLRGMAEEYEAALKKCGVDVTYKDYDDYTHHTLVNQLHSNDNEVCKLVLTFVEKHAGKAVKAKK